VLAGNGLLTADPPAWRRHRQILQPAFHPAALPALAEPVTAAAGRLRGRWDDAPGRLLDVDHELARVTIDVVGQVLSGRDLGEDAELLAGQVAQGLATVIAQARSGLPRWADPLHGRRLRRIGASLDEAAHRVIGRGPGSVGDVLALLAGAVREGRLDPTEVRDEVVTLVIAGHETVAASLTWTLSMLARHPQVQEDLAAEFRAVLGRVTGSPPRRPAWRDLPHLVRTRAAIEESLRLYPPAWLITRRALAADRVGGHEVPAGALVIVSPWLLHRRPDSWDAPEAFRPQRFLAAPAGRPRGDYLPFGLGPRLCIGRDLALAETTLVLATLLPGRRVVAPPGSGPPRVEAGVTLRPIGGLSLRLDPADRS
jgi:cytochrome P450